MDEETANVGPDWTEEPEPLHLSMWLLLIWLLVREWFERP
jgi:hypothetical protein